MLRCASRCFSKMCPLYSVFMCFSGDYLLSTYDKGISEKCIEVFADKGLGSSVFAHPCCAVEEPTVLRKNSNDGPVFVVICFPKEVTFV